MYVDLVLLFIIYAFSVISLGVSLYAIWTLKEIEDQYKNKIRSFKARINHTNKPPITVPRKKGHWD